MKRITLITLTTIVATLALAGTAQATFTFPSPRIYINGVESPPDQTVRMVAWGTQTFRFPNSFYGSAECRTASVETAENKIDGPPPENVPIPTTLHGWGTLYFECSSPTCEGNLEVNSNQPDGFLVEPAAGVVRNQWTNASYHLRCAPSYDNTYTGEVAPRFRNVAMSPGAPEEVDLVGTKVPGPFAGLEIAGRIKLMGYGNQGIVGAHRP